MSFRWHRARAADAEHPPIPRPAPYCAALSSTTSPTTTKTARTSRSTRTHPPRDLCKRAGAERSSRYRGWAVSIIATKGAWREVLRSLRSEPVWGRTSPSSSAAPRSRSRRGYRRSGSAGSPSISMLCCCGIGAVPRRAGPCPTADTTVPRARASRVNLGTGRGVGSGHVFGSRGLVEGEGAGERPGGSIPLR